MTLQITFSNFLRTTKFILISTLVLLVLWWFWGSSTTILIGIVGFHLLMCLPAIYLHIEYYFYNGGCKIVIADEKLLIIKKRGGKEEIYNLSEFKKIIVYKSAGLDKNGIQFIPMESYFYTKLILNNNKHVILTCLIAYEIDNVLRKFSFATYERKKRPFCSIFFE